ncbi:MAG: S24 family peptidase [Sulfurimonadaceae bacterium]
MKNARDELNEIKALWGLSTDEELANKLKISKETVNSWIKRDNIPEKWILKIGQMNNKDSSFCLDSPNEPSNVVSIPYYENTYGAMGVGGVSHDDHPTVMSFDKTFLSSIFGISNFKNIHIINAVGDSMSPTISSGELLFVNPFENEDSKIKDRGVYVIVSPNGILVKRIKVHPTKNQWILVSDNPTDADIQLCEDELINCTIVGRVVGHFDRI